MQDVRARVPDTDLTYLAFQKKVCKFENFPDHGTVCQECVFSLMTVSLPLLLVSVRFLFVKALFIQFLGPLLYELL